MRALRSSSLLPLGACLLASLLAHAVLLLAPLAPAERRNQGTSAILPLNLVVSIKQAAPTADAIKQLGSIVEPGSRAEHEDLHGPSLTTVAPTTRTYWPPEELEQLAIVVSAPDISVLEGLSLSAAQIRLRLFIDELGQVNEVRLLHGGGKDWADVQRMFAATAFIPARREGREVASTLDIEIDIRDLIREL